MATLVMLRHGQSIWNLENRFTGWVDVDLSAQGVEEAKHAGQILKKAGYKFELAHTSRLKRAQKTLDIILSEISQKPPVTMDSALNERHYGDLQGLNKDECRKKYGEEQVHIWRRSYDIPPPNGESLADTAKRSLPYFREYILKDVKAGRNILVAAHGNSLRSIVMELDQLTKEQIIEVNIDTGVPYVYQIDASGKVTSKEILGH
ncbi:MAG: 2,3-bisphosphoglycerate-dependent phosphoglycerate mutase [Deltaproteobacteria bacterium]|nr:2,3-bisphosphoglycerate-dependent phosphoglycerate mutase [Deltaproteobacteria bacterium]